MEYKNFSLSVLESLHNGSGRGAGDIRVNVSFSERSEEKRALIQCRTFFIYSFLLFKIKEKGKRVDEESNVCGLSINKFAIAIKQSETYRACVRVFS